MFEAVDGMNDERAFIFTCFGAPPHGQPTYMRELYYGTHRVAVAPSGVGLITTLLALMSAAWILMTLEVAFVVHSPHSAALTTQPCVPAPSRDASYPQCRRRTRRRRVASRGAYTS